MLGLIIALTVVLAPPPQSTLPVPQSTLTSYDEALASAQKLNKPLVVWVGGNFCERCVEDSKNEFAHVFVEDGWRGNQGPATVIFVPYRDGYVYRAGTVTRWTVGSHDWGHVPSARRVVQEWLTKSSRAAVAPLQLLNFGDGTWGMSDEMFWKNYRGSSFRPQTNNAPQTTRQVRSQVGQSC